MIDIPFTTFLVLLALMFGLAVLLDFRRRRVTRGQRESELRQAMRDTIRDPQPERTST